MLYGLVEIIISTGWHETYMHRWIVGRKLEAMQARVEKAVANWWENPDEFTPELIAGDIRLVSKEEFVVLSKYLNGIE